MLSGTYMFCQQKDICSIEATVSDRVFLPFPPYFYSIYIHPILQESGFCVGTWNENGECRSILRASGWERAPNNYFQKWADYFSITRHRTMKMLQKLIANSIDQVRGRYNFTL